MNIEDAVQSKFKEIVDSGFIESAIKRSLESTIQSLIEDSLRQYSEFGKAVSQKIKESLNTGNLSISLPEYNQLICNWVSEIINESIFTIGKEQILSNMKKILEPLEKRSFTISEIISKFMEDKVNNDEDISSGQITFFVEKDHSFTHYYFDKENNKRKYDCSYQIATYNDEVYDVTIDGVNAKTILVYKLYGIFDKLLFQLITCKATITDDSDNVDIYYSNEESD